MKILILALAFAPYSGVGSARMTSLSAYLVKKKVKVTVISYDSHIYSEEERQRKVPEGIELLCCNKLSDTKENLKQLKNFVMSCIQKETFDLCISSVGPFESMFFIQDIWKKYKIPYIIDYRDVWLYEKNKRKMSFILRLKRTIYNIISTPIERNVVKNAAKLVLVTESCKRDLLERYHLSENSCEIILNGYEDLSTIENKKQVITENLKGFSIAVAGKFATYNYEAADLFLKACRRYLETERIRLVHIGLHEETIQKKYSDIYNNVGMKNHKDTMLELTNADALLITYAHSVGLGTKVFDYIALNKPIIYMGIVPSELADFVGQFENGFVCETEEEAYEVLLKIRQKKITYLTKEDTTIYSRENQNKKYWDLLNTLQNQ